MKAAPKHDKLARLGPAAFALRMLGAFIALVAWVVILAWLVGRVTTDRYHWSQWLWWIPTPALLPIVILGLMASWRPTRRAGARKRRVLTWVVAASALLIYFSVLEHRLLHGTPPAPPASQAVKLAHWNCEPGTSRDLDATIDAIINFDADILILTNPGGVRFHDAFQKAIGDRQFYLTTCFGIISRAPVKTVKPLIAVDEMFVSLVEFEPYGSLHKPLIMYLVDMPSDPHLGRMEMMKRIRTMLDNQRFPKPDMVIGDLNIPRGSASIDAAFPGMREAFVVAGHGYGATYHRRFPLWHIDHVLMNDSVQVFRYDTIDPNISRHRAQVAWIAN